MRIVVVHNRYRSTSPSGEDQVVAQEREALAAAGHEVLAHERSSDDIARFSLPRRALVPAAVVWNPFAQHDLSALLARARPDVVHVHSLFPLLSPAVLSTCRDAGVPVVTTFHNYLTLCPGSVLYRTGRQCTDCADRRLPLPAIRHGCYRGSPLATIPVAASVAVHRRAWQTIPDVYLFLSTAQRRALEPLGLPPERCRVKPNMVAPVTGRRAPERLVAYLGRLAEPKGIRVLMRAWERFVRSPGGGDARLAVAGTGPLEAEVRAWALGQPSVEVLGLLDRQGCDRLLLRSSAVVVPSEWQEPFGLVAAEAMAAGVPPVAAAHGALAETVTHGVDGLLYPPGDAAALSAHLQRLAGDPAWARQLGAAARRTYELRFAPARVVGQLEAAYRFAVEHPRHHRPGAPASEPARSEPAPSEAEPAFPRQYPGAPTRAVHALRRWRTPRLASYAPRSTLVLPVHERTRAQVAAVDAHTHLGRWLTRDGSWMEPDVGRLLAEMDAANLTALVNLDGRWGTELEANLDRYDRAHPGRFHTFCHVDWRLLDAPGGDEALAAALRRSVEAGARGLKVWKDLGLHVTVRGRLLLHDDPMLAPLWETAGELGIPVLAHVADPVAFFLPVDRFNERVEELRRYPHGAAHPGGTDHFGRLVDAFESVVAAHPRTAFVGAHGLHPEDLAHVGRLLEQYPNLSVDTAAVAGQLGRQPRAARRLVLAHPERVLFGTDLFPIRPPARAVYFRLLETDDESFPYSDEQAPPCGRWAISGLDLPAGVLEHVYRANAERLLSGHPVPPPPAPVRAAAPSSATSPGDRR